MRRLLAAILLLGLCAIAGACHRAPPGPPPSPALWEVTGPNGQHGYLFGTIHALPDGTAWRTPLFDKAFAQANLLAVEIANLNSPAQLHDVFGRLATTPGEKPVAERVAPSQRALILRVMKRNGLHDADYSAMETWGVALAWSQLSNDGDSGNGVDRALLKQAGERRVIELEGAEKQLGLFDHLPPAEQSDLLVEVARDLDRGAEAEGSGKRLDGWLTGNVAQLEQETRTGLLADPELRRVLLVDRNRDWAARIETLLASGRIPFVAVGAAHLVGPDGLVALLSRRGYAIKRIQ